MLTAVIAFLPTLGFGEMVLLVVIGLLLYGRNLPQAGRTMGQFVAQLKRGFQDFKDQMDRDESLREVRKTIADTTREMRNLTAVPRAIADPTTAVRELAHDVMTDATSDVPDEPPPPAVNGTITNGAPANAPAASSAGAPASEPQSERPGDEPAAPPSESPAAPPNERPPENAP